MDDLALGRTIRTLRLRQHWRQSDLADRAGCSQALVAQLEAGRIDSTTLRTLRAVMAPLGVRAELVPRWRGADIERLLDEDHAGVIEQGTRRLERLAWSPHLEVTYSEYGERGSIDILALLPASRAALVIEAKTELGSAEAIGRKLDEKARLAPRIVERLAGWRPEVTGRVLLLPERSRIRRTLDATPALRRMLPDDPRRLRSWLRAPVEPIALVWFVPVISPGNPRRVRSGRIRPAEGPVEHQTAPLSVKSARNGGAAAATGPTSRLVFPPVMSEGEAPNLDR